MTFRTAVVIDYTNWRGERYEREVIPQHLTFGKTAFHTEEMWLLTALDVRKGETRTFAMKDVHSWRPA